MKRVILLSMVMAIMLSALLPAAAVAQGVTDVLNYQGFLRTDEGAATGVLSMTFRIYDDETAGNLLWTETQPVVSVDSGYFSVKLGSINPIPDDAFVDTEDYTADNTRWLEIEVGGEILLPRTKLGATPYARFSEGLRGHVHTAPGYLELQNPAKTPGTMKLGIDMNGGSIAYDVGDSEHPVFDLSGNANGGSLHLVSSEDIGEYGPGGMTIRDSSGNMKTALGGTGIILKINAADGYVLTSDAEGNGTWEPATGGGGSCWDCPGNYTYLSDISDSVGIGTEEPQAKLHVEADDGGAAIWGIGYGNTGAAPSAGVAGLNYSASGGPGIYGYSDNWHAVLGANSNGNAAVMARNDGSGPGLKAQNQGTGVAIQGWAGSGNLLELYDTPDLKLVVDNSGNLTTSGTIDMSGLKIATGASDGYVMTCDAIGVGTWQSAGGGGGAGGWVDDGANVRLETAADKVGIGTSSPATKLHVTGAIRSNGSTGYYVNIDGNIITSDGPAIGLGGDYVMVGTGGWLGVGVAGFVQSTDGPNMRVVNDTGTAAIFSAGPTGESVLPTNRTAVAAYADSSYDACRFVALGTGWAGYFDGDVRVTGTIDNSKSGIIMDDPLDPENKWLRHGSVNSPDMMNIYNGNVTTDGDGAAIVTLPEYFTALNRDFRYQLTVIGQFAQAIVEQEIENNRFTIRTDKPNVKVSWQVTGIRHDRFAEANPMQVEIEKSPEHRGKYLNPEAFGQSEQMGIDYENNRLARDASTETSTASEL